MCLILDANKYSDFLNEDNEDMKPVRYWIEKTGKIVYSPTRKMNEELERHGSMKGKFFEYRRAGRLKIIDMERVNQEETKLTGISSNDAHIIALARAANAKLLVSGDKRLHEDFLQEINQGKIYQRKEHKHLLKSNTCP